MPAFLIDFLAGGLIQASFWELAVYFLVVTQLTIMSVTLYLHRSMAHRSVDFHPALAHVFRFWTWLTTSMITKEWAAIHRKHHAKCETEEDPHSPQFKGIDTVMWRGVELYRDARAQREDIEKYGKGCPDDWIERHLYTPHATMGPVLMLVINTALFGLWGVALWAIQMVWIPFWAAGVVNGLGHWWGYRNFETTDTATNLTPWGFWIGGEELHNNHHAFPSSAKFALRACVAVELHAAPHHRVDALELRAVRIFLGLALGVVLAMDRRPLARDHRGSEPAPEAEHVRQHRMEIHRAMRHRPMQVERDGEDRQLCDHQQVDQQFTQAGLRDSAGDEIEQGQGHSSTPRAPAQRASGLNSTCFRAGPAWIMPAVRHRSRRYGLNL